MSGQKIIEGLEAASRGDFARVTIDGHVWVKDGATNPSRASLVKALEQIAAMDPDGIRADDLGRAARTARAALSRS